MWLGGAWLGSMCGWGPCMGGVEGGMHGQGACMSWGWGVCGRGACMVGGMHGEGMCGRGHAWQGVCVTRMLAGQILRLGLTVNERECILVYNIFNSACDSVYGKMLSYNNCDIGSYFCHKKQVENTQENYNYKRTQRSVFEAHPCMTSLSFGIAAQ